MTELNEKLRDLTPEEKKATAAVLERLLRNEDYRTGAPPKIVNTLDLIKSALDKPENHVQNPRYKMAFLVDFTNLIQNKIKELNAPENNESFSGCILS